MKYQSNNRIKFISFIKKNFFHRLWIENIYFRVLIHEYDIKLVYNFSGTAQFFMPVPQLIKLQNLMFFSKALDITYLNRRNYTLWVKQIFLKRLVLLVMYKNKIYFEVQSCHVANSFLNFHTNRSTKFYIKSDIDVARKSFLPVKKYNFSEKISFLYIVGPHFEMTHKNLQDFIEAMLLLLEANVLFEIIITLSQEKLEQSPLWDPRLSALTRFTGYLPGEQVSALFSNNTLLISTSIVETVGLHVIEAIQSGIIPLVPEAEYSRSVYGQNVQTYTLFNPKSLVDTINQIRQWTQQQSERHISTLQSDLLQNETNKYNKITDVFETIQRVATNNV